jgi:hypothetical protein
VANTWFAFHGYNNNQAVNVSIFDMTELDALGMHGYPTQAEANAKPNSVNLFQAPIVNAAIDDANNARDVASAPKNAAKAAANAAGSVTNNLLSNISKWVGQPNIWVRGAEVLVGVIVLYIGLKAVTAPSGASAAQISRQTVKGTVSNVRKAVTHT